MIAISIRRTGVAASIAALALGFGAAVVPGVASAATPDRHVASAAISAAHKPKPKPAPSPAPTPAPAQSLQPGPAPTSVAAGTPRRLLGTAASIDDGTVTVVIATSGRYTLEYDSTLPAVFNNVVDGTYLQQTGVGYQTTAFSQTFYLAAGSHTIRLGGPEVYGPATEYLDGPLAAVS